MPQLEAEVARAMKRHDFGFGPGTKARCCAGCAIARSIATGRGVELWCGMWATRVVETNACSQHVPRPISRATVRG